MSKREHISLKTKLASALLTLGHVDYSHAKGMTADQIISLYAWDHGILHAIEPNDSFWNLTPRLIAEHREKSKRDTAIVAKSKRILRKQEAHLLRMGMDMVSGVIVDSPRRKTPWAMEAVKWPATKRRIPSRPFPKNKRKLKPLYP